LDSPATWCPSSSGSPNLFLDSLTCHSVSESTPNAETLRLGDDPPIRIVRARDVLFVPEHQLQILPGGVVPLEGILWRDHLRLYQDLYRDSPRSRIRLALPVPTLEDEVCVLANIWCDNFFHCVESMLKVVILERHGFSGQYLIANLPSFASELLGILGIPKGRILDDLSGPVVLRAAVLATPVKLAADLSEPGFDIMGHPLAFFLLRDALTAGVADCDFDLGPRLWIKRDEQISRQSDVVNRFEVSKILHRHGIAEVEMTRFSVREQISAAHQAELISGPHGAGLVHSMFLPEHATVIECFSPQHVNPSVIEICRLLKHRYHQLVDVNTVDYKYKSGTDVEINLSHLELALAMADPDRA
jgi:hypothetical protein